MNNFKRYVLFSRGTAIAVTEIRNEHNGRVRVYAEPMSVKEYRRTKKEAANGHGN
jgi:hypothetical protein